MTRAAVLVDGCDGWSIALGGCDGAAAGLAMIATLPLPCWVTVAVAPPLWITLAELPAPPPWVMSAALPPLRTLVRWSPVAGSVVMELSAEAVIGTARRRERARMASMWFCLERGGVGDRPAPSGWRRSVDVLVRVVVGARLRDAHIVAAAVVNRLVGLVG